MGRGVWRSVTEGVHDGLVHLGRIAGMSAEQVDQCIDNKAEDDRINKVSADGEAADTASTARPPS